LANSGSASSGFLIEPRFAQPYQRRHIVGLQFERRAKAAPTSARHL
jgi:hypothetical protein